MNKPKVPADLNGAAMPYRDPAAWAAMFERVKAAGANGVVGYKDGLLYLTRDARFVGTIPMEDRDRACWA